MKNLRLIEEELPGLNPDEVTVGIKAVGLNFADVAAILGLYRAIPKGSFIPGLEYSGVVEAVGPEVTGFSTGDRVMGISRFGSYTDRINIPFHYLKKIPDTWSFEEGAAWLVHGLTAYYALVRLAGIQEGQTVLIHAGAGGVGLLANRIAKKFNSFTIGTTRSTGKMEFMKAKGYDAVILRTRNFRNELEETLDGRPLHIVLDSIGGQVLKDSFRLMAPEGRLIVYGSASFMPHGFKPSYWRLFVKYLQRPKIDPMRLPEWNKSVMGFNLIYMYEQKENLKKYLDDLERLQIGKPYIGHRFAFDELLNGVRLLQSGKSTGKIVIRVEQKGKSEE